MRALCWHGKQDFRYDTVPDPRIQHGRDAIIRVTACDICGSDLHLTGGFVPNMKSGDVMGHETMGRLKVGDRVVVNQARESQIAARDIVGIARAPVS